MSFVTVPNPPADSRSHSRIVCRSASKRNNATVIWRWDLDGRPNSGLSCFASTKDKCDVIHSKVRLIAPQSHPAKDDTTAGGHNDELESEEDDAVANIAEPIDTIQARSSRFPASSTPAKRSAAPSEPKSSTPKRRRVGLPLLGPFVPPGQLQSHPRPGWATKENSRPLLPPVPTPPTPAEETVWQPKNRGISPTGAEIVVYLCVLETETQPRLRTARFPVMSSLGIKPEITKS